MIEDLIHDLQLLQKADSLIARIWLNVLARRLGLFVFAGLIAVFGLGMTNVAGFYALQAAIGPVWAAAIVAAVDFMLAAIVMLVSKNAKPGSEIDVAFDVRKMAVEAVRADARNLKTTIDAFGQDIRDAKDSIARFVHDPLDTAVQKLLIPAAVSLITSLRSKKE